MQNHSSTAVLGTVQIRSKQEQIRTLLLCSEADGFQILVRFQCCCIPFSGTNTNTRRKTHTHGDVFSPDDFMLLKRSRLPSSPSFSTKEFKRNIYQIIVLQVRGLCSSY